MLEHVYSSGQRRGTDSHSRQDYHCTAHGFPKDSQSSGSRRIGAGRNIFGQKDGVISRGVCFNREKFRVCSEDKISFSSSPIHTHTGIKQ